MSESEKNTYTLEEMRGAFVEGCFFVKDSSGMVAITTILYESKRRYPFPKRLREVQINSLTFRVRDGRLEHSNADGCEWRPTCAVVPATITVLADLLAHPYMEAEEGQA